MILFNDIGENCYIDKSKKRVNFIPQEEPKIVKFQPGVIKY